MLKDLMKQKKKLKGGESFFGGTHKGLFSKPIRKIQGLDIAQAVLPLLNSNLK